MPNSPTNLHVIPFSEVRVGELFERSRISDYITETPWIKTNPQRMAVTYNGVAVDGGIAASLKEGCLVSRKDVHRRDRTPTILVNEKGIQLSVECDHCGDMMTLGTITDKGTVNKTFFNVTCEHCAMPHVTKLVISTVI